MTYYMEHEQCHRCILDHCCYSNGSFIGEDGNTPNNCKEFMPVADSDSEGMSKEFKIHILNSRMLTKVMGLCDDIGRMDSAIDAVSKVVNLDDDTRWELINILRKHRGDLYSESRDIYNEITSMFGKVVKK